MSSSALVRWGGIAALGAGLLLIARALLPTLGLDPPLLPSPGLGLPGSETSYGFAYLALSGSSTLLLLGGLLGLHASSAGGRGRPGTTGFLMACAGVLLAGALEPAVVLGERARPLLDVAVVAGLVGLLGLVLLGVSALRSRTLSLPWGAVLLEAHRLTTTVSQLGMEDLFGVFSTSRFVLPDQVHVARRWSATHRCLAAGGTEPQTVGGINTAGEDCFLHQSLHQPEAKPPASAQKQLLARIGSMRFT